MTNPDYTHLAFVIDRSGSMETIKTDMEGAIHTVLKEQSELPGELRVDIWTFDTIVDHPYKDARADDVKGELIIPRDRTALNDALGSSIVELGERFAAMEEDDRPGKVIIAVVTDGLENASREYTREAVKALVERQKADYGWEVLFFGADSIDAFAAAHDYGISRGQTMSFAGTSAGVAGATMSASGYMTRARLAEEDEVVEFTEAEREAAEGK